MEQPDYKNVEARRLAKNNKIRIALLDKKHTAEHKKMSSRMTGSENPMWKDERDPSNPRRTLNGKFAQMHRSILGQTLHRLGTKKQGHSVEQLGYSATTLKEHLEHHWQPGMSWFNYGKGVGKWSIDHTRPIVSFNHNASANEVSALNNLKPMWYVENSSKGDKWEGK